MVRVNLSMSVDAVGLIVPHDEGPWLREAVLFDDRGQRAGLETHRPTHMAVELGGPARVACMQAPRERPGAAARSVCRQTGSLET